MAGPGGPTGWSNMPRLGAHLSIAGGLPRAVDRAVASRCEALQIFTKSAGQWRARELPDEEIATFRRRVVETGLHPVVAHNSYLINLAAASAALRAQSMAALRDEFDRAESLGLDGLVMHPGSHTSGTEEDGLRFIGDAIGSLLAERPRAKAMVLLEHTAGQGTNLGHRFEHLAAILDRVGRSAGGTCRGTRPRAVTGRPPYRETSPAELVQVLKKRKRDFARCLSEKLLTYALGRGLMYYDRCAVDKIVDVVEKDEYRFSTLIVEIVKSEPFRKRRGDGGKP